MEFYGGKSKILRNRDLNIHGTAGAKSDKIEYLWWQDKGNIFVRQTLYQIPLLCNKKYNYHEITNKYCLI